MAYARVHPLNPRKYGSPPFRAVLVHGGPGAAGEMAPVARELSHACGVLEPLQTARSLQGQVRELKGLIRAEADGPVVLIGFSWGAWLAFILAAVEPGLAGKLVLVGSGPFEEKYAQGIHETRWNRLNAGERQELTRLTSLLEDPASGLRDEAFRDLGQLISKADTFDLSEEAPETVDWQADIFRDVWKEGAELRRNHKLLEHGRKIKCPVVAIHGAYDPHPADGVRVPLSSVLKDFRFFLLERCGHRPWAEKQARERFYRLLLDELG